MLTILGPTATGKTRLAALIAHRMQGEVISADSRQVYKGMDLGTGKDLSDYYIDGIAVPYHLIDIAAAGEEYNIFRYQKDFRQAYDEIIARGKLPVLCGGSGMYIEAVLGNYSLSEVPENPELREEMAAKSTEELIRQLASMRRLHATTDTVSRKRLCRAIEIETFHREHPHDEQPSTEIDPLIIGISMDREMLRRRITERLRQRMEQGMIEEVYGLIKLNVPLKRLLAYGLEYKFITLFLQGKLSNDEMFRQLNIAIGQFAKRQMTWFRRMERNGYAIHWIDGTLSAEHKVETVLDMLKKRKARTSAV